MTKVKFVLKNFQINYFLEGNFKSMFIPFAPVTPQSEELILQKKEFIIPLLV